MMLGGGGYNKIRRRDAGGGRRGFRLSSKTLSVHRLRARFVYMFRLLRRWRCSYQSLKRSLSRNCCMKSSRLSGAVDCRMTSSSGFRRSNSFYSEAIADCLEFIKKSSNSED